ncbi:MAG: phage tail protein, partial [Chthoniobacterales bacterium]
MQPSLAMSNFIATQGYFPNRDGPGGLADDYSFGSVASPFVGQIFLSASGAAPTVSGINFMPANGTLIPIAANTALFSLYGTTYGGNGSTNYALPDLRGRAGMGQGGVSVLGETQGEESTALLVANLPPPYGPAEPFSNKQPSLTLNYLICADGADPVAGTSGDLGNTTTYLGEIITVGFNFAPSGWYQCAGQILPIAGNESLYGVLGTTYGGNGVTTFALPDFRDHVVVGFSGILPVGSEVGVDEISLLAAQSPIPEPSAIGAATAAMLIAAVALRRRRRV